MLCAWLQANLGMAFWLEEKRKRNLWRMRHNCRIYATALSSSRWKFWVEAHFLKFPSQPPEAQQHSLDRVFLTECQPVQAWEPAIRSKVCVCQCLAHSYQFSIFSWRTPQKPPTVTHEEGLAAVMRQTERRGGLKASGGKGQGRGRRQKFWTLEGEKEMHATKRWARVPQGFQVHF